VCNKVVSGNFLSERKDRMGGWLDSGKFDGSPEFLTLSLREL